MSKVISQDTFDDIVKENVVEFSMSPDEAKEETIKQFEAQGINLANIIKDLKINTDSGKPVLNEAIEHLKSYIDDKSSNDEALLQYLYTLHEECQKSIPHRVLASKNGAQSILLSLLEARINSNGENSPTDVLEAILKCLNSLTNKQPDIFNANALALAKCLLDTNANESIICLCLQWLQKACVMHEINRQNIMNANIVQQLKRFVSKENGKILREVLAIFRYLTLDDDIRTEFGSAHENACQIANEVIKDLTALLKEFEDTNVLADSLLTIGCLAVRQEICMNVDEVGGIKLVFEVMVSSTCTGSANNLNVVRLNREALKLLRALAGHDTVKNRIVQEGGATLLKELLQIHISNEQVVSAALACISTLTLRVKENSKIFFETGIAEIIVETLRTHPENKIVQRNGAWAVRNMVSRSREQCNIWLSFGIEDLLNAALNEHPSVHQDIKAALRDLGCNVELKEEWTGTAEKKILNS
uniref:Armadillo repeat-containing protein 6 homolog n=1 Tax=Glossina pallidipes TaxID=7398 RepID=A0A1B0AGX4_GLOPL